MMSELKSTQVYTLLQKENPMEDKLERYVGGFYYLPKDCVYIHMESIRYNAGTYEVKGEAYQVVSRETDLLRYIDKKKYDYYLNLLRYIVPVTEIQFRKVRRAYERAMSLKKELCGKAKAMEKITNFIAPISNPILTVDETMETEQSVFDLVLKNQTGAFGIEPLASNHAYITDDTDYCVVFFDLTEEYPFILQNCIHIGGDCAYVTRSTIQQGTFLKRCYNLDKETAREYFDRIDKEIKRIQFKER